jgi:hypothetical protein
VSTDLARRSGLDQLLAKVLHRGTWLGSSVIALGLALPMAGWSGASSTMICTRIVTAGIALLISLPVLRVLLMLVVFVRERDFLFSAIAMLVLAIILLGSVLGGAACARFKNVCPQTGTVQPPCASKKDFTAARQTGGTSCA